MKFSQIVMLWLFTLFMTWSIFYNFDLSGTSARQACQAEWGRYCKENPTHWLKAKRNITIDQLDEEYNLTAAWKVQYVQDVTHFCLEEVEKKCGNREYSLKFFSLQEEVIILLAFTTVSWILILALMCIVRAEAGYVLQLAEKGEHYGGIFAITFSFPFKQASSVKINKAKVKEAIIIGLFTFFLIWCLFFNFDSEEAQRECNNREYVLRHYCEYVLQHYSKQNTWFQVLVVSVLVCHVIYNWGQCLSDGFQGMVAIDKQCKDVNKREVEQVNQLELANDEQLGPL